jgi:hypothetical protein
MTCASAGAGGSVGVRGGDSVRVSEKRQRQRGGDWSPSPWCVKVAKNKCSSTKSASKSGEVTLGFADYGAVHAVPVCPPLKAAAQPSAADAQVPMMVPIMKVHLAASSAEFAPVHEQHVGAHCFGSVHGAPSAPFPVSNDGVTSHPGAISHAAPAPSEPSCDEEL